MRLFSDGLSGSLKAKICFGDCILLIVLFNHIGTPKSKMLVGANFFGLAVFLFFGLEIGYGQVSACNSKNSMEYGKQRADLIISGSP
ncbi:hypothetical protein [Stenoxybacter acetivorans]|uniref:hypothetical protein n=1 Tax=Stenoxybacter acetivorans TaxID=422441 RepID=UPI0012EB661A|nr:hypothetical protein [Stenoxybacter acetivorans]